MWPLPIYLTLPLLTLVNSVIPAEDGHLSEYVAESDKRLHWISNFTGSAGTAIVSKRSAYLFVDSRYWLQAEQEVDINWTIHKTGTAEIKDWLEWAITCPRGSKIAIDSRMISHERATRLYKGLYDRGSKLAHPRQNLVDLVWSDRPARPKDLVYVQPIEFTGKEVNQKLSEIRKWIRKQNGALGKEKGGLLTRSGSSATKPGATKPGATKPGATPTPAAAAAGAGLKRSESSASQMKPGAVKEAMKRSMTTPLARTGSTPPARANTTTPTPPSAIPARLSGPTVKRSNSSPGNGGTNPGPAGADRLAAMFISDLASIAYTLNLRGADIPFNPVFTAYLLVGVDGKTVLFIDGDKVPKEVKAYLNENGVSVREYSEVWSYLRAKQWGEGKVRNFIHCSTQY